MMQDDNSPNVIQLSDWRAAADAPKYPSARHIRSMYDVLADRWLRVIAQLAPLWQRLCASVSAPPPDENLGVVIDYPSTVHRSAAPE